MSSRAPRPSWAYLPSLDDPPATILDWLASRFSRIEREIWIRRLEQGLVKDAAGNLLTVDTPYEPHLRVAYYREVEDKAFADLEVDLIHLDEHLIVADKPPFMPVTPGGRFVRGCLLYRLEEQLGLEGLAPAHRLDRATSGLVMFTRRSEERAVYTGLFAHQRIERTYFALARVPELPQERRWRAESRIVSGTPFFRMREIDGECNACTLIELIHWEQGRGHFRLRPQTGKTHQLRLHMAGLGWPILGDRLYPDLQSEAPDDLSSPLCLVASRLVFRDPVTGEQRDFESRLRSGSAGAPI